MLVWGRWVLAILVAAVIVGVPWVYYRATFAHAKRLREIEPGKAYRCGQLTADGFREAVRRYDIKIIINLREDNIDPLIPETWQGKPTIRESELCRELGVRYELVEGGNLSPSPDDPDGRPKAIDDFLSIVDEAREKKLPFMFHCAAGRDRTGQFTALYRMEYNGWSKAAAVRELKGNGFETFAATEANAYLRPFIRDYQPGVRRGRQQAAKAAGGQNPKGI
jgi:tyrosine-protein phosphatase SIW14